MGLRKILTTDEPALHKVCRPVEKFDWRLHKLLDDMRETLAQANGVGLAAPQVGILRRVVLVDTGENILELVNPELLETDGENPQHAGVLNAFAAHILHGAPLVAKGAEGVRALMLSNAMHLSSWLGRPVELPIDEALFARLLAERRSTSRHKEGRNVTFHTDHSATGKAL